MADAAQLYAAFRSACSVDEDGVLLPPLEGLEDEGRGWFAIENAVGAIASPAADTTDPYEIALEPIEPRMAPDGLEIQESEDERPSKITIRGFTASDLCVRHLDDRIKHAVFARAMGLDLETVEWRMDPTDVEGGVALCVKANGRDAADLCKEVYFEGGGTQLIAGVSELAWIEVAQRLLTEIDGTTARVRCRTPGVGVLTIGPIKAGHMRLHAGTAARERSEWMGRLVALAKASDRALGMMLELRTEDAINAWDAFVALKKKAGQRQNTAIGVRLSSMSMADGDLRTSTT
ncbi:MAG TPA: hypothetical protein VMX57_09865 [Planctomycetota bacterium]|nr:hypothetical protein [Planctomycetota bacterium]